jgi:sulfate transport system permease protein
MSALTSRPTPPGTSRLRLPSGVGLGVVMLWLSLLVLLPLAAVVATGFGAGWHGFIVAITQPETLAALRLTVGLALLVAIINIVTGTMIAWVLVRDPFPGSGLLDHVIDIPFALPTIVAGVVMLTLYGAQSPIGVHLVGTRAGLLVALLFVTLPFTVRTVAPVLQSLDRDVEEAAASLGASSRTTLRRIVLPAILPAIASGSALSFARALGEYGSLVLISSNLPFKTQIASVIIFGKLQDSENPTVSTQQAAAIATILLAASVLVLVVVQVIQRRVGRRG